MPWEVVGEDSNSEEAIPTFWDSVEANQKDVSMSLVDCPYCNRRLRVPETYSGRLTCPSCSKWFQRQNGSTLDQSGQVVITNNNEPVSAFKAWIILELFAAVLVLIMFLMFNLWNYFDW
jgi:hypothetical protein|tara:strand:+ start:680 stop:1036 length:357 start_codon:yes stop_codon:yes gene_type:complete